MSKRIVAIIAAVVIMVLLVPTIFLLLGDREDLPNNSPIWNSDITSFKVKQGSELVLNLNDYFQDPDKDRLNYMSTSSLNLNINIKKNIAVFKPLAAGTFSLSLFASDGEEVAKQKISVVVEGGSTADSLSESEETPAAKPALPPKETAMAPPAQFVEEEVKKILETEEEVEVIIQLPESVMVGFDAVEDIEDPHQRLKAKLELRKGQIAQQQDELLALLSDKFSLKRKYSTFGTIAGTITKEGLEELQKIGNFDTIQTDKVFEISRTTSIPQINADDVWQIQAEGYNLTGSNTTICVIDTGIDNTHQEFGGRILDQYCYCNISGVECCPNGDAEDTNANDDNSHGTHVAGIAAGNGTNVKGVAPDANLVIMKVCNSAGSCGLSDLIAGIDWCNSNASVYNISVITMSIADGGRYNSTNPCPNHGFDTPATTANSLGIIVTAASGNNGYTDGISSPACAENITSVGAVNSGDSINYNRGDFLDMLAPGVSISSTVPTNTIGTKSGTSMATPHAAGAAALIIQHQKLTGGNKTPAYVRDLLKDTGKIVSGYPRIDVHAAIIKETTNVSINQTANSAEKPNIGRIKFGSNTDFSNYTDCINITNNSISVSSTTCSEFNKSAEIRIEGLPWVNAIPIRDGEICPSTICENQTYVGGVLTFNVSYFSTYSANGTSNLTIWDSSDLETIYENQTINFYANFTNSTGPANKSDGGCQIQLDTGSGYGSFSDMTYNVGSQLFNHTTNFTDNGTFEFNVSCNGVDGILNADDAFVIAQEEPKVGILECVSRSTSCLAGETDILSMSNYTNAHAELGNESGYSYRICCKDTTGRNNLYNNITGHFAVLMNLSNYTNAHAELPNQTNYTFAQYFGADADRINCSYTYTNGTCSGNSVCVATLSNYTNAHVANCSFANYNLTACCEIQQIVCGDNVIANLTLQANKAQTGAGTCFTVAADNIKINCSGYNITGGGDGIGINISNRENVTIVECRVSGFTDGIAVDPSSNIVIRDSSITGNYDGLTLVDVNNSLIQNNNISGNTDDGLEAWNSSVNRFENNTFVSNGGNGLRLFDCRYNNITNNTFTSSGRNDIELLSSDEIRIAPIDFDSYNFSSAGIIFENSSVAEIIYLNTSITENGTDIKSNIIISSNSIFVNSTAQPGLNTSANITLYGISMTVPQVEVDYEDDGTYSLCSSPTCYNLSYSGTTFTFNTTHFTTFKAAEASLVPPNITLLAPPNNTLNTTSNMIYFRYNVTDDNGGVDNCSLVIDGVQVFTNSSIDISLASHTINYSVANGEHDWSINCTDNSSNHNEGYSATWNISVDHNQTPQFNTSNLVPNVTFSEDQFNDTINLSEHFYDAENDTLYYSASDQNLAFNFNNVTGIVNITADGNFTGERYVVFTASDTISSNTSNNVTINVTNVDDPPYLTQNIPDQSWTQDSTETITISTYFTEVDGQEINYSINTTESNTSNINITVNNTAKTVLFTPDSGFTGTRYVTFIANDSSLLAESNNVTLTVNAQSSGGGGSSYTPPTIVPTPPAPVVPTVPTTPTAPTQPTVPTTPAPSPVAPSLQSPANIGVGGSPQVACSYVTQENTQVTTTKATTEKKIRVPRGYELIIDPFNVDCPSPEYELTLNIPENYEDLKALRCKGDECSSVIETKTVVEELICGGQVISEIRREELTKREKKYIEPKEFDIILEAGKRITPADTFITTSGNLVRFTGLLPSDLYATLKRPEAAVPQPKNPSMNIIGTPLILKIDTTDNAAIPVEIILPFTPTNDTEEDSLVIHVLHNGKWEYLDSTIDKQSKRITAEVNDIKRYADAEGRILFAVLGVVCEACTSVKFEKIYHHPGSRDAVILIHGFSSSPKTYQLLIDDFVYNQQPWQIWTLAYPSNMGIDDVSIELADMLEGNANQYDNIFLVGHSMGGLIAQQALRLSYTEKQKNPSIYSFVDKTKKIITIGAPNDGSPAAELYSNLYNFLMNEETAAKLFNINSKVVNELVQGKNVPQVPGIEYYVIAGTNSYEFNTGIFKLSAQQIFGETAGVNDGIVTTTSAQHIGNTYVNDMCTDYWEINVSHTDLLANPASRKVVERILSEAIAEKDHEKALIGFNQYFKLKIKDCNPQDVYAVIGRKIDEKKAYDPLLQCSCGNGYCGVGETEFNCPADCATIIRTETLSFLIPVLIYLILILTLVISLAYAIERDYLLKPVSPKWNWAIRVLITVGILFMLLHGLIFGFTLYYSYLIEIFVIMYLSVGAELRKKMLRTMPKIEVKAKPTRPLRQVKPQPAKPKKPVKPAPKMEFRDHEDPFDKMAREFEEWKDEKKE